MNERAPPPYKKIARDIIPACLFKEAAYLHHRGRVE